MRILTADIGGTSTKMGICDGQGQLSEFKEYATESRLGGPHVISRLLEQLSHYNDFDGISISTAGQVNAEEGFIVYANDNIPNYTGMPVRNMVQQQFGVPVNIENDVNAAALGEARFGAGKPFRHFLCLTYGTGIGGAIMMDGQLYKGAGGVAGEFGHMLTRPASYGSAREKPRLPYYESFASTSALVKLTRDLDAECVDGRILFDKIENGDVKLKQALQQWTDEVSYGLASIIHIFNPAAIVIGGGVMEQQSLVQLVEAKTKALIMDSFADVQILKASLGNKAGLLGAASLFMR